MNRRSLLQTTVAASAGLALHRIRAADSAQNRLKVAVVALGRGMSHVQALLKIPNVEIKYLAEVDAARLEKGMKAVAEVQKTPCKGVNDFRTFLDDKELDAVFIATPNFWHTPAALLCMKAGKHVYVEKPGSQNPRESEMIVEAAKQYKRVCQMGNQRRSWPGIVEGIAKLQAGGIGKVHYGRAWYDATRKAIAQKAQKPQADFDLELWQGPVPEQPDVTDYVHYDWHWRWHYGNGELGNNGVHSLDVVRWGLGVDHPKKVSYLGGRYWFDDKQETPDSGSAVYDFGTCGASWEQSSCHPSSVEKHATCGFYGEGGSMYVVSAGCVFYDQKGVKTSETKGPGGDIEHVTNFLDGIRGNAKLNSSIEVAQVSAMLCHLGNIAYRTGEVLSYEPGKKLAADSEAGKLWARDYRKGWDVSV